MDASNLSLHPDALARRLLQACALMVLLGIACHAVQWWAPPELGKLRYLARLFDLNEERTVPTAYAVAQLLLAAGFVALIAWQRWRAGDAYRLHWVALALLLLLLALDEQAGLHERLTAPMRQLLGGDRPLGLLHYAWVVPGAALVLGVALGFARFVWHLPADTRRGVVLAGAIFVGGALGMELLGGRFVETEGLRSVGLLVVSTLEEAMELFGIALLVRTMARHAQRHIGPVTLRVAAEPAVGVVPRAGPVVAEAPALAPARVVALRRR